MEQPINWDYILLVYPSSFGITEIHRPWGFSIRDYSLTSQRPWRFSILHGYTVAYEEEEWIKYYRWMKRWMNYKKQKMLALYCWKRNVGLSATNWFNRNFLQKKWYFFLFNNFEQNKKIRNESCLFFLRAFCQHKEIFFIKLNELINSQTHLN